MTKLGFSAAASFAALLLMVVTVADAKADYNGKTAIIIGPDSFGLFVGKGHAHHGKKYKRYKYRGHKSGYWYKRKRGHYKGHHGHKGYGYGHKGYGHGHHGHKAYYGKKHYGGHGGYRKACHPVYKYGYHRGYRAKIGGTMCYDRYGNGYVVRGSRYVIDYY